MSANGLSAVLVRQLEPPLNMLASAVEMCPDDIWAKADDMPPVWQHILHCIYYLDMWMRKPDKPFAPPSFVSEAAINFTAPAEPAISRSQLSGYLQEITERCFGLLAEAEDAALFRAATINGGFYTLTDRTLGQVRHVMYHVGCISAILSRYVGEPVRWIGYDGLTSNPE